MTRYAIYAVVVLALGCGLTMGSANKPLLTANDRNVSARVRPDTRYVEGVGSAADSSVYASMQATGHPVKSAHGGVVAFTASVSAVNI